MDTSNSTFDQASTYSQISKTVQFNNAMKLLNYADIKEGNRVLDIGCGTGLMDKTIADMIGPAGFLTGVDPDDERLQVARRLLQDYNNLTLIESRSNDFPFQGDRPYDVVVSNIVYHWVPNEEKVLSFARVFTALKPGGKFAASMLCGRVRTFQPVAQEYCKLHPEFGTKFEQARSCVFYVSSEWLQDQLTKIGFSSIVIEQVEEPFGLPTPEDFIDWCQASSANTPLGEIDYRSIYEEVKHLVSIPRLPDGQVEVIMPTCYFSAIKPLQGA